MASLMKPRERKRGRRLTLSDAQCPVCFCIFIEPVTLPCQHELCMPCFKQTLDKVNLTCPMCRLRISSWARNAKKQNRLINQKKWKEIKRIFPQRVNNRLRGIDESFDATEDCERILSEPGEIGKEYEEQRRKVEEEKEKIETVNEKSFWNYMTSYAADEKMLLPGAEMSSGNSKKNMLKETVSESVVHFDEPIHDDVLSDPEISRASQSSSCANKSYRSVSEASNDSISQELCHFKPIKTAPKTPPKPRPDGRVVEPPIVMTTPRNLKNLAMSTTSSFSSSSSSIDNCTSLRRKLYAVGTDRLMMSKKREDVGKCCLVDSTMSLVPPKLQRRRNNNQFSSAATSTKVSKSILPLEPNIPLCDQTSTYQPSTSTTSSFVGLFRVKPKSPDDEGGELNVTRVSSTKLVISVNKSSASKRKWTSEVEGKNDASTSNSSMCADSTVAQIVEQQMAIMKKLKQEEADRLMAQKLQQNYDHEWRNCRGSREPYQLRKRQVTAVAVAAAGQRRKHI